ncbi:MAG: tail fiber domain-containing protein [Limisphaerales bacterium]
MDFIKGSEQVKIDPSGIDISGASNILLKSDGKVGIGTNNPQYPLQVNGTQAIFSNTPEFLLFKEDQDRVDQPLVWGNTTHTDWKIKSDTTGLNILSGSSGGGTNTPMSINNTGNVGIGKTADSGILLDVGGNINFNGDLYKNGSLLSLDGNQATAVISKGMAVQIKHTDYTKKVVRVDTGWSGIDTRDDGNGFVVKITPRSVNSKVLINAIAHVGIDPSTDSRWWGVRLYRKIGNGNWNFVSGAQGDISVAHSIQNTDYGQANTTYAHQGQGVWFSHTVGMLASTPLHNDEMLISNSSGSYLDSPSTTEEVMYTLYWCSRIGDPTVAGPTIYLNRAHRQDDYYRPTPISSITATEIWDDAIPFTPTSLAMVIDENTNYVGIGTSNPTGLLEINSFDSGNNNHLKLNRWNNGKYYSIIRHDVGGPGAATIDSLQFIVEGQNDGLPDNEDVKMVINSNGFVGIGTDTPEFPLQVEGSRSTPLSGWYGFGYLYRDVHGNVTNYYNIADNSTFNNNITIRASHSIISRYGGFLSASDNRIKTDISIVNDDTALNQVNQLECKEYHYVDPTRRRPVKTIGFIAQEVKEVIPNAVSLQTDYIPDEMRVVTVPQWTEDAGKYYLNIPDLDMSGTFTGKAKFYVSNDPSYNDEVCKEVDIKEFPTTSMNEFSTTNYVAEFDQSWNNVFFYGKEVPDFHTIDKAQIFALHHSAIQELDRKHEREVTEKNARISALETENASIKTRLEALEASVLSLQNN